MKTALWLVASLLLCTVASAAVPSSINNDDSCDIRVGPAATLLLPYFEVDVFGNSGRTTLFTITNVSRYPQIAHVTLWTDSAYPVLTFNLFLTGYDVQAINLADVLLRGTIAPPGGTSPATTPGSLSAASGNLRTSLDCAGNPAVLPASIIADVRDALTLGIIRSVPFCSIGVAGGVHIDAIGYATIDVVANCTNLLPFDPLYYTTDLLFDNVLIGDYQQIGAVPAGTANGSATDATGNPMVHIRAVPEGGGAGSNVSTALPYTFYDRYTPSATRAIDRRQPLPSTFAARYVQGSANAFATNFNVWREGTNGSGASCKSYVDNSAIPIAEIVRFDEHENPFTGIFCAEPPCPSFATLPADSATNTNLSTYPPLAGTDVAGWMYVNLNNGGSPSYSTQPNRAPRPSQNWVTISMFGTVAGNRMTAEFDAAPLGNGCSPASLTSSANSGPVPIGPAGGVFVCPPGTTLTNGTTALCAGTNINPNP